MIVFLWASALALPTSGFQALPAEPLLLDDKRFHYAVSKPSGAASSRTRTLWVSPAHNSLNAQKIPLIGPAAEDPLANVVVRDVNFDGQPDLMITSARGNVNSQYAYWLYDAPTQRFVLSAVMSNTLSGYEVTFNPAKQQVVTVNRFTCCEHETRTYLFKQGKLKLLISKTDKVIPATAP